MSTTQRSGRKWENKQLAFTRSGALRDPATRHQFHHIADWNAKIAARSKTMIRDRRSLSNVINVAEFSAHLACKQDTTSGVEPLDPGLYLIKKRKPDVQISSLGTKCVTHVESSTQSVPALYQQPLGRTYAVIVEVATQSVLSVRIC